MPGDSSPNAPGRYLKRLDAGHRAGVDLYADGKYVESEQRFANNVELARSFGEESSELIDYLRKLGDFYHSTGNYSSAEQPLLEAMKIIQERFGMEDYQVAPVLNDVALLYYAQGRYQKGESSFKRLRKISKSMRLALLRWRSVSKTTRPSCAVSTGTKNQLSCGLAPKRFERLDS